MSQTPVNSLKTASSSSKAITSAQVISNASPGQHFFSGDTSQRRSGSNAPNTRQSAARNNQSGKAKHKSGKKFKPIDIDEDEAELYTMQNPNNRRGQQSITHLMNFALPPRPHQLNHQYRHNFNGSRRGPRINQTWGMGSGYHAVDKARYVHANYRFIVDPRGDYTVQAADADVHLDWNNVLQVIASEKSQAASCPICLGEPTGPRMARCGHIFCLPCLIRYMHSEDTNNPAAEKKARWKKCPICWDSIYISETRPVRWYVGQESEPPREGGDIVLRLVKRKPGSTLAMPRESADPVLKGDVIPWSFAAEVMDYSRVMKGSEDYMLEQYDQAIAAIRLLEKEDELMFGEDAEWTGRAIRMLQEGKEKLKGIGNAPAPPKKPESLSEGIRDDRAPIQFNEDDEGVPDMYLHKHADYGSSQNASSHTVRDDAAPEEPSQEPPTQVPRTLNEMRLRQTERPQPNEYLFYQAILHYYLSPLDIRILKTAFGSYHQFPSSILSRVERISTGHIVDDDLRKRVKYLSHLPYGCEVAFLECDWTDTISSEVLSEFRPMLDRRRKRHDEKEAREEKERVRIEKAEERELAAVRRKRPSISQDAFSAEQLPPLGFTSTPPVDNVTGSSPPWANRTTSGFTSLASPSSSPSLQRTVWGTAAVGPASPDLHATLPKDDAFHEDDGWLQGWEKDLLDQRQEQLVAQAETLSIEGQSKPSTGGRKGKKGKKITLMSTTARRGA